MVYAPAKLNIDGERDFTGFAIAIPDVSDLADFCDVLPNSLRTRGTEMAGYRPREAVIDLAAEGAIRTLQLLVLPRLPDAQTESILVKDCTLGIDVVHT